MVFLNITLPNADLNNGVLSAYIYSYICILDSLHSAVKECYFNHDFFADIYSNGDCVIVQQIFHKADI